MYRSYGAEAVYTGCTGSTEQRPSIQGVYRSYGAEAVYTGCIGATGSREGFSLLQAVPGEGKRDRGKETDV